MKTPPFPPESVQWHEGMLLSPQHFQQAFLRQDLLLNYFVQGTTPYAWGVTRLQVDQSALVGGVVRIIDLEAVMPDGLPIIHPLDDQDLSLDISDLEDSIRDEPQVIYLAVPVQRGASPAAKGELNRFASVEGGTVPDMNTGEGAVSIPRLRPRPRLMLEKDLGPAYAALPLTRIVVREEALGLDNFLPPMLRVSTTDPLGKDCLQLARRLREKAAYLVERVRAPTAATADHMIAETRSIVASLMGDLPPFEALLNSGVCHPFPLYVSLCGLVGNLAPLSAELMPPSLPPYDHNNLRDTFDRALNFARRMVESVHESCMAMPFRIHEGSFSLPLRDSWIRPRLILGVRHRVGSSEADSIAWITNSLIGGASKVNDIGAMRIRGLDREPIDREESMGITPGRGQTLFAVDYDPSYAAVGEPLVIINRSDLRGRQAPAEIVLFVPVSDEPPTDSSSSPSSQKSSSGASGAPGTESAGSAAPSSVSPSSADLTESKSSGFATVRVRPKQPPKG